MEYNNPNKHWQYCQKKVESYKSCFGSLLGVIILAILCLLLSGCKVIEYVPVEVIKKEFIHITDTFMQKDSIVYYDSVYIHSKEDTVWYEKWHTRYKDRVVMKLVVDSFIKNDTIKVPYPVERKLTKWEKFTNEIKDISLCICLFVIIMFIINWLIKKKR